MGGLVREEKERDRDKSDLAPRLPLIGASVSTRGSWGQGGGRSLGVAGGGVTPPPPGRGRRGTGGSPGRPTASRGAGPSPSPPPSSAAAAHRRPRRAFTWLGRLEWHLVGGKMEKVWIAGTLCRPLPPSRRSGPVKKNPPSKPSLLKGVPKATAGMRDTQRPPKSVSPEGQCVAPPSQWGERMPSGPKPSAPWGGAGRGTPGGGSCGSRG